MTKKIFALEAQLKDLQILKLSAQLINKLKQGQKQGQKGHQQNQKQKGTNAPQKQGSRNCMNQKHRTNRRFQKQDEEWERVPPKENEPKQKQVGTKTFIWCIHHIKWVVHMPEECDIGKKNAGNQGSNNINPSSRPQSTENQTAYAELLVQLALQSINESTCAPAW